MEEREKKVLKLAVITGLGGKCSLFFQPYRQFSLVTLNNNNKDR